MSNGTLPQPPAPHPMTPLQKVLMAKEMWHLNKFNIQAWLTQRNVKKLQDGTIGQADAAGDLEMPGDIKVGDTYQYPTPPAQSNGLLHAGIGAGLLAGGIGLAKMLGVGAATVASGPAAPIVAPLVEKELSGEGTVLRLGK